MVFYLLLRTTYNYVRVIVPLVGDPDNLPDVLGEIVDSPRLDRTFFYNMEKFGEACCLVTEVLLYAL